MESVRWDEIEVFVRSEVGLRKLIPLSVATRLWEDLGQTGDEADDLMGRFFERFSVDAGDFDFHRYFLMEGEGGLYSLLRGWVLRKPHALEREPITLAMLHRAAVERKWDARQLTELSLRVE
ncbi:DUF1493 family protein [Burkholderia lata]|uniref:Acyl carrier protein n=1 Tax=Burkholderia lata (strain ATCC 17760 / DSM 23089 / LMG 22485 / NCIMB 9086 / R18194 / 383) TaxID=482957 RepID=A0A6P2IRQ4_BURL3|nr:DUF1493 family protein [Burkholderia lata]VWB33879.1 acyl carrier protein [Burkholderia lata]VWC35928.1 acyl carrier protein [Burkholderia lata]